MLHAEERTNYPLTLSVDDLGEGFQLTAQVQRPLDPDRVCAFMRVALERLVETLETAPETATRTIDVLPEAERRQMLVEWNDTAVDYPRDRLLHELFEEQVGRAPEAVAVVFEDTHLTYAELNGRANRLAHHLRERGVGPDVIVGICVERSLEMMVGLLGILKAGGAYLPLDPDYPRERLAYMLADAAPVLVLTQEALRERSARDERGALSRQGLAVDRWCKPKQSRPARDPAKPRLCHLHIRLHRNTQGSCRHTPECTASFCRDRGGIWLHRSGCMDAVSFLCV